MAHYSKDSSEYQSNGHYIIDGTEFMSVWTFKNNHGIQPNDWKSNGTEGQELIAEGVKVHSSTPDFGNFDKIYIYPVNDLEVYYGV